ncbi:uncharacterized protein LOC111252247 isoform X3 [Varroa destructor]|nr:uncharacterized protein LOC111252247 isoform X3 [Varroa destructor]XP_022665512.1 uncharacterized protein LOC111252247 isoform X3 [Varroa destructor]
MICSSQGYCSSSNKHSEDPRNNVSLASHSSPDDSIRIRAGSVELLREGGGNASGTTDQLSHEVVLVDPSMASQTKCAALKQNESDTLQTNSARLPRQQLRFETTCPQLTGVCTGRYSSLHIDKAVYIPRINHAGSFRLMDTPSSQPTHLQQEAQQNGLHSRIWPPGRRLTRAGMAGVKASCSLVELRGSCGVSEMRLGCGSSDADSSFGSLLRLSGTHCGRPARLLHFAGRGPDTLVTANGVTLLQQTGQHSVSSGSIAESAASQTSQSQKELRMIRGQLFQEGDSNNNNSLHENHQYSNMIERTLQSYHTETSIGSRCDARPAHVAELRLDQTVSNATNAARRHRQLQEASSGKKNSISLKSSLRNSKGRQRQSGFRDGGAAFARSRRSTVVEAACNTSGPHCKLRPALKLAVHSSLSTWNSGRQRQRYVPNSECDIYGSFKIPSQKTVTVTAAYATQNSNNTSSRNNNNIENSYYNPHQHPDIGSRRCSAPTDEEGSLKRPLATKCQSISSEKLSNESLIVTRYSGQICGSRRVIDNAKLYDSTDSSAQSFETERSFRQESLTETTDLFGIGCNAASVSTCRRKDQTNEGETDFARSLRKSIAVNIEKTELLNSMAITSS